MWLVLRQAWWSFRVHEGSLLSGAVAFYALLALAPFGVIAVSVAGWVLGAEAAQGELTSQLEVFIGGDTARFLTKVVDRASQRSSGAFATTFSILFLIFASTRLFWMLRAALNHVWGVRSKHPPGFRGVAWKVLQRRLIAFGMVGVLGASLVAAALVKAGISAIGAYFGGVPFVWRVLDAFASIGFLTLVVALIYRWLPDARIAWRDVFAGAFGTSVLATFGSWLIGHYVARVRPASMYGAAGSLVVLLLWVYYTAQIFFFGAELTAAWALHNGDGIEPLPHATRVVASEQHPIFEGYDVPAISPEEENARASSVPPTSERPPEPGEADA
ncbi:MAG: hypothetical protein CMN29_25470 [Sandaracinus sp.]|nr:hypothetical protein [Sandaracinus sp.]